MLVARGGGEIQQWQEHNQDKTDAMIDRARTRGLALDVHARHCLAVAVFTFPTKHRFS